MQMNMRQNDSRTFHFFNRRYYLCGTRNSNLATLISALAVETDTMFVLILGDHGNRNRHRIAGHNWRMNLSV